MHPRPPWPAATWMSTSSTKDITVDSRESQSTVSRQSRVDTQPTGDNRLLPFACRFDRVNVDPPSARAVVFELDASRDLGKQRVVLSTADVEPRFEAAAALPNEDRSASDHVAVEPLHAQPLR